MTTFSRAGAACLVVTVLACAGRADEDQSSLARQARAILQTTCYRCHGQEGASEGGFNYILDRQRLVAGRKIVPGNANQSRLYKKLRKDEMPPEDEKPRPTEADVAVIRHWIEAGAPDFNPAVTPRPEITTTALLKAIVADLEQAGPRDRRFQYPLGPGGADSFSHAGGEIIFNLPNGLQGYMLVDGQGNRIDRGPTNIVSDPKQADRAVVNGLSCMSCHARGMIDKSDQVREYVLKNPKAFSCEEVDNILALYPPKKEMDKLLQEDAARFARAVIQTGGRSDADGRLVGSDPVVSLALLFERELDLTLAAAEAGVTPAKFLETLDRSPGLARALGVLKVEGGTVQREAFVAAFGELMRELNAGEVLAGGGVVPTASTRPLRPGERLFDQAPVVYLVDVPEIEVKKGEWPVTKDGSLGNDKDKIRVNRVPSPKGIGMHPPSATGHASIKYRLAKQAALFKTIVGINDTTNWTFTGATFTVWGDGKELFRSKLIAHTTQRTQECTINVTGVDVLELRVVAARPNHGLHAVWIEPRLLQRRDTPDVSAVFTSKP